MLDRTVRSFVDQKSIDLDKPARFFGLEAFRQAPRVALFGGEADPTCGGIAAQCRRPDHDASVHELAQERPTV